MSDVDEGDSGEHVRPSIDDRAETASRARPLSCDLGATSAWSYGAALRDPSSAAPDGSPPLLLSAEEHANKLAEWGGIVKEVYGSVYDPTGLRSLPPGKRHSLAAGLAGALEVLPQWPEIRAAGRSSRVLASAGTVDVTAAVASALGIDKLPEDRGSEDPQDVEQQIQALQEFRNTAAGQKALGVLEIKETLANARRETILARLKQAQESGALGAALQHAADVARERAEAAAALRACGLGPDPSTGLDPLDLTLLDTLRSMPDLRKIVLLLGRMRRAVHAEGKAARGENGRLVPVDVRQTTEPVDLLAQEWAMEAEDPDLFARRWLDRETMGVAREGQEPRERGDLVVLVDKSGSMSGERIQWARALAGAAMVEAVRDGRRVTLIMYDDRPKDWTTITSPAGLGAGIKLLGAGAGGGTDTAIAVRFGLDKISSLREPDILVVTDGEWPELPADLIARVEESKARLSVVLLEGTAKIRGAHRVWSIPHLSMDQASEIIREVAL